MKLFKKNKKIRYAVVGLGNFAQMAVLPAFAHAKKNSELVAFVSGDPEKRRKLGKKYQVSHTYNYEEYEECLKAGEVDAVYIVLPNDMHADYTIRAANAGVHVLCEKPMAVTQEECESMLKATEENNVKLMIAYRLHLEEANLKASEIIKSKKIGDPRIFNSIFSMQVKPGNIRVESERGGGTVYDIGIYCINAARYLFQDEPTEVVAFAANKGEDRFKEIDEMTSVILRFPHERLATFTSSFGASDTSVYHVVGTQGEVRMEPAYEYSEEIVQQVTFKGKKKTKTFAKRDQMAAELLYFSDCVLNDEEPEPSGKEGLIDVKIIQAIYASAQTGKVISLGPFKEDKKPDLKQEIKRPPVRKKPEIVNVESPHY